MTKQEHKLIDFADEVLFELVLKSYVSINVFCLSIICSESLNSYWI